MPTATAQSEKRMTWDEMVKKYPDMWVAIKDAKMDGADILSGVLIAVKPDEEIDSFEIENWGKGYEYRRTSEGFWSGSIGSSIVISVD